MKELSTKQIEALTFSEVNELVLTLQNRVKTLEDALRFYAELRTWNQWLPDAVGDKARAALKELGKAHA